MVTTTQSAGSIGPVYPGIANHVAFYNTDQSALQPNFGFVPGQTGPLAIRGRRDGADVTIAVVAGSYYPIDVIAINFDATVTSATVLYQYK